MPAARRSRTRPRRARSPAGPPRAASRPAPAGARSPADRDRRPPAGRSACPPRQTGSARAAGRRPPAGEPGDAGQTVCAASPSPAKLAVSAQCRARRAPLPGEAQALDLTARRKRRQARAQPGIERQVGGERDERASSSRSATRAPRPRGPAPGLLLAGATIARLPSSAGSSPSSTSVGAARGPGRFRTQPAAGEAESILAAASSTRPSRRASSRTGRSSPSTARTRPARGRRSAHDRHGRPASSQACSAPSPSRPKGRSTRAASCPAPCARVRRTTDRRNAAGAAGRCSAARRAGSHARRGRPAAVPRARSAPDACVDRGGTPPLRARAPAHRALRPPGKTRAVDEDLALREQPAEAAVAALVPVCKRDACDVQRSLRIAAYQQVRRGSQAVEMRLEHRQRGPRQVASISGRVSAGRPCASDRLTPARRRRGRQPAQPPSMRSIATATPRRSPSNSAIGTRSSPTASSTRWRSTSTRPRARTRPATARRTACRPRRQPPRVGRQTVDGRGTDSAGACGAEGSVGCSGRCVGARFAALPAHGAGS